MTATMTSTMTANVRKTTSYPTPCATSHPTVPGPADPIRSDSPVTVSYTPLTLPTQRVV